MHISQLTDSSISPERKKQEAEAEEAQEEAQEEERQESYRGWHAQGAFTLVLPATDHELTTCDSGQMCAASSSAASSCMQTTLQGAADLAISAVLCSSTADEASRLDPHQHQHSGFGALGTFNSQGGGSHVSGVGVTEGRSCAPSPEVRPAPIKSSPTPDEHRPFPLFADGDNIGRGTETHNDMERAFTSGLETGTQDGETIVPAPVAADRAANISGEGVNVFDDWNLQYDKTAPLVGRHGDKDEHTNATGLDATQLPLAQREVGQAGTEAATLPFGLPVKASMHSYRSRSHDLDTESDLGDMQEEFSNPMDEDEDEDGVEPSFGVGSLSNTTCDRFLAWHPDLYGHSLHILQDDHVGEDNSAVDLAMEDAATEARIAIPSVTATESSLQPFSWIPPSASSAFHASFPGVPYQQTAALVNGPTHVIESPTPGNPFAMDMTISEGGRLQHAVHPPDIAWPFVPNGTDPSPSVEVEMFKEPEHFIPKPSPTPVPSIFASQATGHLSLPPTSSPASRAGPVPASPSTCGPIGEHTDEVKGPSKAVDLGLAVVDSVQHNAPPLRCVKSRLI